MRIDGKNTYLIDKTTKHKQYTKNGVKIIIKQNKKTRKESGNIVPMQSLTQCSYDFFW